MRDRAEVAPRAHRNSRRGPSVHMLLIQATCAALILAYTLPSPHAAALSRSPPAVTMRGGPPAHVTAKKKAKKKKVAKIKAAGAAIGGRSPRGAHGFGAGFGRTARSIAVEPA